MAYQVMTVSEARKSRGFGYLTEAGIEDSSPEGWHIWLAGGSFEGRLGDSRTKSVRYFKTADAAIRALRDLGFAAVGFRVE